MFIQTPGQSEDYTGLSSLMGLYFQVRDDYANLVLEDYHSNKSFAEDFTEGKYSFPVIHAMSAGGEAVASQLRHILRQRTSEVEVKRWGEDSLE